MKLGRCGAAILAGALLCIGVPAAIPASAVVGGQAAEAASYPWLAAIGTPLFLTRPSGQFCAGVLIAPDQVVTAAHCVELARIAPAALSVTFGRSDLRSTDGTSVRVKNIRVHPDFRESTFEGEPVYHNDLAVLTLDRAQSGPVLEIGPPQGDSATILGWGATGTDDSGNTRLNAATVPLASNETCATAYGPSFDPNTMLCAGSTVADTAEYDSGGPLLVNGRVVALTSWGKGAAQPGYPGVYTRLTILNF
ncbi:S1 family peptidase [Nocardia sp. NPDC052566]|uniref:S1 family peptidase n=1 Tax=Nocardia sp. NPDC052566 TaxID=3364330 RepID=UPI0037C4F92E